MCFALEPIRVKFNSSPELRDLAYPDGKSMSHDLYMIMYLSVHLASRC